MNKDISNRVLNLATAIQQIPGPTFQEHQRAEFICSQFKAEKLKDIEVDEIGNVYARLPGKSSKTNLIVSAHTDTVFPKYIDLSLTRTKTRYTGPGIGDNAIGVAGLFGLVWELKTRNIQLPGDLWLAANVCEEGLGDLKGMKAVVDRFGKSPLAYIVIEGMGYGLIYHRGLGVRRYRITAKTDGGHSWARYGNPSAIHELARLITKLTAIKIPEKPRTSMNVGVIHGGTSINTIAAQAELQLDLRSENTAQLNRLSKQIESLVKKANKKGVKVTQEVIGDRPVGSIDKKHPLVKIVKEALNNQGCTPEFIISSTDANIPLSRGLPALCIGLTNGDNSHTMKEYIEIKQLKNGLNQLVEIVEKTFIQLGKE